MADTGKGVFLIHKSGVSAPGNPLEKYGIQGLRLPVAPLDSVVRSESVNVNTQILPKIGSTVFGGGPSLTSVTINTIFPMSPAESYRHPLVGPFYDRLNPKSYDVILSELAEKNTGFTLVISDINPSGGGVYFLDAENTFAQMTAMIQSFNVEDSDGIDLYCTIEFIQYREIKVKKYERDYGGGNKTRWVNRSAKPRPGEKKRPKIVNTKKGRDIQVIARVFYGSANQWRWLIKHPKNAKYKNKTPKTIPNGSPIYLPDTTWKPK